MVTYLIQTINQEFEKNYNGSIKQVLSKVLKDIGYSAHKIACSAYNESISIQNMVTQEINIFRITLKNLIKIFGKDRYKQTLSISHSWEREYRNYENVKKRRSNLKKLANVRNLNK